MLVTTSKDINGELVIAHKLFPIFEVQRPTDHGYHPDVNYKLRASTPPYLSRGWWVETGIV